MPDDPAIEGSMPGITAPMAGVLQPDGTIAPWPATGPITAIEGLAKGLTVPETVAWHHDIPGVCNHIEYHILNGCHRSDGTWRALTFVDEVTAAESKLRVALAALEQIARTHDSRSSAIARQALSDIGEA